MLPYEQWSCNKNNNNYTNNNTECVFRSRQWTIRQIIWNTWWLFCCTVTCVSW